MRPKKARELLPTVADQLQMPLSAVEDIHSFYWREVREELTAPRSIKVHVTNLGDFNTKHWLLDKEIRKLEAFAENSRLRGNRKIAAAAQVNEKLNILYHLKSLIVDENQRKEFIYEHKKAVKDTEGQTAADLDE